MRSRSYQPWLQGSPLVISFADFVHANLRGAAIGTSLTVTATQLAMTPEQFHREAQRILRVGAGPGYTVHSPRAEPLSGGSLWDSVQVTKNNRAPL